MAPHYVERTTWKHTDRVVARRLQGYPVSHQHALERYMGAPRPFFAGARALDVGCGSAQGSLILRDMGWKVTAFDKWDGAADLLREAGVEFVCRTLAGFRHRRRFNLICCCDVLEHIEGPEAALAKMASLLAVGGRIHLTVPIEGARSPNPYHVNAWTQEGFCRLLSDWVVYRDAVTTGNYQALIGAYECSTSAS